MQYNQKKHHRRSVRLRGYDYSAEGSYFVTICVHNRECVMGKIRKGELFRSPIGDIVNRCWLELPNDYSNVSLDEYQIMPNHFHGIIVLWEQRGDLIRRDLIRRDLIRGELIRGVLINQIPTGIPQIPDDNQIPTGIDELRFGPTPGWQQMKNPRQTLGKIIRHFKAKASKEIHDAGFPDFRWQSRFHDRIIRNEEGLERIREYTRNNVQNWAADDENSALHS